MGSLTLRPFDKLLVANRGEIAARILRTARSLGYATVAVYSEADRSAPYLALADEAICIGPAPVGQSYQNAERLLEALSRSGADALHPGYGFLSENAEFARQVLKAGAVWVGPPPEAIDAMGDKARAKIRMKAAGVPCVPGFEAEAADDSALIAAAEEVGFPLLVKASAGGGGRGMRRVAEPEALPAALASARAEALHGFGNDALLLERLVEGARHIEVQVFADGEGKTLHFGERECSVQRRHQKVLEEAPSPAVDPALRQRMGAAAVAAAKAVGYVGAGTVEFLLAQDGEFFFLEMNTRLQVEHPVTEEVYGVDLVALQLSVASGEPLAFEQPAIAPRGHAIEARLYAEDPAAGFLPQPGTVHRWQPPPSIRVDSGLAASGAIDPAYDPMVAKLIARGTTREMARRRLLRALEETVFFGVPSNRLLLHRILRHPRFIGGDARTDFLDEHPQLCARAEPDAALPFVAAALWLGQFGHPQGATVPGGFRSAHLLPSTLCLALEGEALRVRVAFEGARFVIEYEGLSQTVALIADGPDRVWVELEGHRRAAQIHALADQRLLLRFADRTSEVGPLSAFPLVAEEIGGGAIRMPMAGQVLSVSVEVGQPVRRGEKIATVEAMKLESVLVSAIDGVVVEVLARPGLALAAGAILARVEEREETS